MRAARERPRARVGIQVCMYVCMPVYAFMCVCVCLPVRGCRCFCTCICISIFICMYMYIGCFALTCTDVSIDIVSKVFGDGEKSLSRIIRGRGGKSTWRAPSPLMYTKKLNDERWGDVKESSCDVAQFQEINDKSMAYCEYLNGAFGRKGRIFAAESGQVGKRSHG